MDIDKYIYKSNLKENQNIETLNINHYYTIIGDHDFLDDNNMPRLNDENKKTLAKSSLINRNYKYYLKIGPHGKIYNPIGMFSEGKHNKYIARIGRDEYVFKEVNKKIFDMYLNFLSTKNLAWLINAERGLI